MTNELRHRSSSRFSVPAFWLALLAGACGGSASTAPRIGSESHFLAYCTDSCSGGFDCIGGICTKSCLTDATSCADLGASVDCTNQSVEPGEVAVCDASCTLDADCSSLGSSYQCRAGFCRQPLTASGSEVAPGSACREAGRYEVGKDGGYLPCCAGLTEISTLSEATDENGARFCTQLPLNTYACIVGTCGDGICEAQEMGCGCETDCLEQSLLPPIDSCDDFRNHAAPSELDIRVTNAGTRALYIQPVAATCDGPQSLVQVQRAGVPLQQQPSGCVIGCQRAMDDGWPLFTGEGPPDDSAGCPDEPCGAAPVLIQPGQTLARSPIVEVAFQRMPGACAEGTSTDAVNCYAFVTSGPGNYTLQVRAGLALQCRDVSQDCACRPDADGTCTNPNVFLFAADAPFSFTLEGVPFLGGQSVTITAPEE
jgi:hypothetical protein